MLGFVKCFFCLLRSLYGFCFYSIDMEYYINLFLDVKPTLHSHLVMVYNRFDMLPNFVCSYFVEGFASMFIWDINWWFSFLAVFLSGFSIYSSLTK